MELMSPYFLLIVLVTYASFIGLAVFLVLKWEKNSLVKVLWILSILFFPIFGAFVYLANFLINKKRTSSN